MQKYYHLFLNNFLTCDLHIAESVFFDAIFTKKYILYYYSSKKTLLTNFYLFSFIFFRVFSLLKQFVQRENSIIFITEQLHFSYCLKQQSMFNYSFSKMLLNPKLLNDANNLLIFFKLNKKTSVYLKKNVISPIILIGCEPVELFKTVSHPLFFLPVVTPRFSNFYFYLVLIKFFLQNLLIDSSVQFSIPYNNYLKNHF